MLLATIIAIMLICLFLEIPMTIGMFLAGFFCLLIFFPDVTPLIAMQEWAAGVSAFTYVAIPMYILAAEIMCNGTGAERLLNFIRSLVGHVRGGVAITTTGTCTLFGAISGSAMATLVAVGKPMWKELKKMGYPDKHVLGLTVNSATIAVLIPPSVLMILYAITTGCSVADLFISGVTPGLLLFALYSIFEIVYAKRHPEIIKDKRRPLKEVGKSFKAAVWPLGFPFIILGGIYTGICTPTEAAVVSVFYAAFVECIILRTLSLKGLCNAIMSAGITCGSIFCLCAAGMVFSWVLTYASVPQTLVAFFVSIDMSQTTFLIFISIFMFITCMFMDNIPAILVLTPMFWPTAQSMGIDPVVLGIIITMQAAVGAVTPPFGCNIFTACAIFDRPYVEVVKGVVFYMLIALAVAVFLVFCPQFATFLVR